MNATWFVHSLEWTKSNFSHIKESPFNSKCFGSTLFVHRRRRWQRRRIMCFTFNLLMCIQIKWSHSLLLTLFLSLALSSLYYFNSIKLYVCMHHQFHFKTLHFFQIGLYFFLRFILFTLSDYFQLHDIMIQNCWEYKKENLVDVKFDMDKRKALFLFDVNY